MNYLNEQMKNARDNYNYFFIKLIFCIFKIFIKLSIMLLISIVFNYTVINIISLIYTIYSMYIVFTTWKYYFSIISDIGNTLGYNDLSFEIDTNSLYCNMFKGVVKYGK